MRDRTTRLVNADTRIAMTGMDLVVGVLSVVIAIESATGLAKTGRERD